VAAEATLSNGWFQVMVLAELGDDTTAARAAQELRDLVAASARHYASDASAEARARLVDDKSPAPLTPPEATALDRAGLRSEIGVGWPGSDRDTSKAVLCFGRVLAISGLKGDFAGLRRNPLAALLGAQGARVFVEGDPAGGSAPVVDLSC